jgi:VIT1/CCC1 family predicted Fe2+/Mn2+ transporter
MPTDSIVYVLIVCIVILTILGSVLAVLKCRSKKRENYLYKGLNDQ